MFPRQIQVTPEEPAIIPELSSTPIQESGRNICDFDLFEKESEFGLTVKGKFASFQGIHSGRLDHRTCLARISDFVLTGEDCDNLHQGEKDNERIVFVPPRGNSIKD